MCISSRICYHTYCIIQMCISSRIRIFNKCLFIGHSKACISSCWKRSLAGHSNIYRWQSEIPIFNPQLRGCIIKVVLVVFMFMLVVPFVLCVLRWSPGDRMTTDINCGNLLTLIMARPTDTFPNSATDQRQIRGTAHTGSNRHFHGQKYTTSVNHILLMLKIYCMISLATLSNLLQ